MLRERILSYIRKWNMIPAGTHVICGVSGGADSTALFLILCQIREELAGTPEEFSLEVLHVEHGIRGPESLADAAFTEELCRKQKVPCTVVHVDVPRFAREQRLGIEEAARMLRYQNFRSAASGRTARVALAHHMEDNAETLLFQMARGSSLHGLSGMKPVRSEEDLCYIRPLLCVRRRELEQYLRDRGQNWRTDATNEDTAYSRNRIRHAILPQLEQINSRSVEHLNQCAVTALEASDYIREQMLERYRQLVAEQDALHLNLPGFWSCHPVIRKELLMEFFARGCGKRKDIGTIHVQQLLELAEGPTGKKVPLPYGMEAVREYEELILRKKAAADTADSIEDVPGEYRIVVSRDDCGSLETAFGTLLYRTFAFDGNLQKISKNEYTKWFDYDKIKSGFCVRTRRSGDYLVTDAGGHRKKLTRYFIDEKIPPSVRAEIPLLAVESDVFWIIGGRIGEHVKVTDKTNFVTEVSFLKGEHNGLHKAL